jgi:hypothetical protein
MLGVLPVLIDNEAIGVDIIIQELYVVSYLNSLATIGGAEFL